MCKNAKNLKSLVGCLACLVAAAAVVGSPGAARAGESRPAEAKVEYIGCEVVSADKESVVIRAKFCVTGALDAPVAPIFNLSLALPADGNAPLYRKDGKPVMVEGQKASAPERSEKAVRHEVQGTIKTADLEAAGLPKDKRVILWAACCAYDTQAGKYLHGNWWGVRAPLIVTTDNEGKVAKFQTFPVEAMLVSPNEEKETVPAREYALQTKHLKLKEGAKLYRVFRYKSDDVHFDELLLDAKSNTYLYGTGRGYFFERIDSPEKAVELALLACSGGRIIKTQEQFKAVADGITDKKVIDEIKKPEFHGVSVSEEPGLGYCVRALVIRPERSLNLLGDIDQVEWNIGSDGRIGEKHVTCIISPESMGSLPPGDAATQVRNERRQAYDKLLKQVLKKDGVDTIGEFFILTGKKTSVPVLSVQYQSLH